MSSGLLSDVFISIREGKDKTFLEPGSEIPGREAADLFGAMGELAGEVTALTRDKLTPLIERLGQRLESIGDKFEQGTPLLIDKAVATGRPVEYQRHFAEQDSGSGQPEPYGHPAGRVQRLPPAMCAH